MTTISPVRARLSARLTDPPVIAIPVRTPPPTRQITRDTAMRTLVGSPLWATANADDRRALLSLLDRLGPHPVDTRTASTGTSGAQTGYDAFVLVCQADRGGTPLLLVRSRDGRRVLDHLAQLTIDPKLSANDREVLAGLLLELADPGRIDQGEAGTCSVTALQVSLATYDPAEYARVACGLLSPTAVVKLRGGAMLRRDDNSIMPDARSRRTLSERVFQGAMIQAQMKRDYLINEQGEGAPYNEREIAKVPLAVKIGIWILFFPFAILLTLLRDKGFDQGLDDKQVNAAAAALFGTRYRSHKLDGDLAWLRRLAPSGDFRGRHITVAISPFREEAHALLLERVDYAARAVILRNPWGSQPLAKRGDPVPSAPRGTTYEDPARGTIRISGESLARITTVHYPG